MVSPATVNDGLDPILTATPELVEPVLETTIVPGAPPAGPGVTGTDTVRTNV